MLSNLIQSSKTSVTNVFTNNIKHKKSLIYQDGSSIGRAEAHEQCKKGFDKLCKLDNRFHQFESLYSEETIDMVPQLLKEDRLNEIKKQIRLFLCLVTPYLEIGFVIQSIEWLVFKYEIHIHQPEDILMSCLPYHNQIVFIKFLRLIDLKNKDFSCLNEIQKSGKGISANVLSSLCLKNPNVLEMICSWPIKFIELTNSDQQACKELCHVIICLGINILDKVRLLGEEKIEKYLNPFIRIIIDGLNTTHINLNASSIILLVYFSEIISLDRNFLYTAMKKILKKAPSENRFVRLRAILDVCYFQKIVLKPKLHSLFMENLEQLNEKEKSVIEQLMSENSNAKEETDPGTTMLMDIDDDKPTKVIVKPDSVIVKEIVRSISIDWKSSTIETDLIQLLKSYVLNWKDVEINPDPSQKCKPSKISFAVMKLFKDKPKELQIEYKSGGLISHLCYAILYPDMKIKKLALKLIKMFANNWSKLNNFATLKSNDIEGDPDCLNYGIHSTIILQELDGVCHDTSSLSMQIACLSMINQRNITMIPDLKNVWSLFLSKLQPNITIDSLTYIYRENLMKCLQNIRWEYQNLPENHQQTIIDHIIYNINSTESDHMNCAIEYLCQLSLSFNNIKYLLNNNDTVDKEGNRRKTMKKFKSKPDLNKDFYTVELQNKFIIGLSAFCRMISIKVEDQLMLIDPIVTILGRIVTHFSLNKMNDNDINKSCNIDEKIIDLVTNIMSAILNIFTSIKESIQPINLQSISNKIRLEVFSKCLYLFSNPNLNEVNLSVIQSIVKLGLGLEQFNLIYFISWIGNHLVPREDQHSLTILNTIINETLPLCIKQKKENSCDKVQIIIKFINECTTLPKHRVLLFFKSLVKSLSVGETNESELNESVLWIQLLFMVAIKPSNDNDKSISISHNECLIMPLLTMFPIEDQLFALKKIISFLTNIINDPSRKRKFIETEISSSPMNKKRKTVKTDNNATKTLNSTDEERDFLSVKENLLSVNKRTDLLNILRTMLKYCSIHLSEKSDLLISASGDILKDFISTIFVSMKQITRSTISDQEQNEFCQSLRNTIECVGSSLSRNLYLSMIIDLAINDNDETVKSKCIELLSNKLSTMVASKQHIILDQEINDIIRSIIPWTVDIIVNKYQSIDWSASLICITNLVALGFTTDGDIGKSIDILFNNLLNRNIATFTTDKIIISNMFFKNYVDRDCYDDLVMLFNCCLSVIDKCVNNSEFNNGELESSLALMHAIISREDSHNIGWESFSQLLDQIFRLVSIDCVIRKLSHQSCDYQKYIRMKLSKMSDTKSLINTCIELTNKGVTNNNLTFISGSLSLLGCHLTHLNKNQSKYNPNEEELNNLWDLIYRSLSLNEIVNEGANLKSIEEISIKSLNQMCYLFDLDADILTKLIEWTQKSDLSPRFYLQRNTMFFKFINYLISKSNNNDKVIEFINNSECISRASGFFKHLSVEIKTKRRKIQSSHVIHFTSDKLTGECPTQCADLIKSICDGLLALLSAENKRGMNMSISDETIELITNVCKNMLSIDQFLESADYQSITEKHMIPLIVQMAANSLNDEALLTPLALGLCKHFTELSSSVHLAVLKTLADLKSCLGNTFDTSIRDNVSSFLEDCKLHDDERIADLANDISCGY